MKKFKWLYVMMLTFVLALGACTDDSDVDSDLEPAEDEETIDIEPEDEGPVEPE